MLFEFKDWYQYYHEDIDNLFYIFLKKINIIDKMHHENNNQTYTKFVYLLYHNSSHVKPLFLSIDELSYDDDDNYNDYSDDDELLYETGKY